MEESLGAQYAIQIAVHTLRDRCKSLQQRIASLEEENVNLRVRCSRNEETMNSVSAQDKLKEKIVEVTEQRDQLHDRIKMVSSENQDLWSKLGKLINVNKNLGEQLNKINETITQHTSTNQANTTLIRSKTFTQDEPHTRFLQKNLEINENISLELENISLKLTDSFSKQKMELDQICSEIDEIQYKDNTITENFGFCFDDELEDDIVEEFKYVLEDLKMLRGEVTQQKDVLQMNLKNLDSLQSKGKSICKSCSKKKHCQVEKSTSTFDIPKIGVDKFTEAENFINEETLGATKVELPYETEKICPVCSKFFRKDVEFSDFQQHVEAHFIPDVTSYEIL